MRLIDSHCHLQADRFDADRDDVLRRARDTGIERLLVPGWDLESSAAAVALARRHDWLDAAVGIHPHDAAAGADAWPGILGLAEDDRVVAIGETGLDYDRMFSPVDAQRENLGRHLELGRRLGKPVILHCRSRAGETAAHDDLLAELDRAGVTPGRTASSPPAVLHSFSGSTDFAAAALARGLAISVSGLAFRHGEEATADVVRRVPAGRLLVETDAPFLPPPGAPRWRNEPEWVRVTTGWAAERRTTAIGAFGDELVAAYDATFVRPRPTRS
jgi:TatD DNase family protein